MCWNIEKLYPYVWNLIDIILTTKSIDQRSFSIQYRGDYLRIGKMFHIDRTTNMTRTRFAVIHDIT